MTVVAKERRTTGATAARRATATAERCKNMVGCESIDRDVVLVVVSDWSGEVPLGRGVVVGSRGSRREVVEGFGDGLICRAHDLTFGARQARPSSSFLWERAHGPPRDALIDDAACLGRELGLYRSVEETKSVVADT